MSLTGIIVGSIAQLCLAMFLFMLAAFAGGGMANGRHLSDLQMKVLNIAIYLLPFLCLISAGIVLYCYTKGGTPGVYWWYSMPIVGAVIYCIYVSRI